MTKGVCLICGASVDDEDISRDVFPAVHRGCGGEVAIHLDIKARMREVLFPKEPTGLESQMGPSLKEFRSLLLGPHEQSQAERFIRWLYGLNVRFYDRTAGQYRLVELRSAVTLLRAFEEAESKRRADVVDGEV